MRDVLRGDSTLSCTGLSALLNERSLTAMILAKPPDAAPAAFPGVSLSDEPQLRLADISGMEFLSDPSGHIGLSMTLAGAFALSFSSGGSSVDSRPHLGQFGLMAPGHPSRVRIRGRSLTLQLCLPLAHLRSWWAEDADADPALERLRSLHSRFDPTLAQHLIQALLLGRTNGEAHLRGVALRLLPLFDPAIPVEERRRGGLTGSQVRRVRDYVESDPARALTLSELAGIARLSPFHFAREFKHTTGWTPWDYVVQRRLLHAATRLRDGDMTVDQIALACGFSNASHLSRHLRRVLGLSPAPLRQLLRGGSGRKRLQMELGLQA